VSFQYMAVIDIQGRNGAAFAALILSRQPR
jgi:hypothetical protein